ncbi:MAG: hypothetical protein U1F41_15110 [Burkholderiales bacterium]
MSTWRATVPVIAFAVACAANAQTSPPSPTQQQRQQDLTGAERTQQRDGMTPMTAAQQADYKAQYEAAKAKWASLTPDQKKATIDAARTKKLSELSYIELVGQRDDMKNESAKQAAQLKAQADVAKARWDKMSPAEKQAVRKAAWSKKRAELDALEAVGQRDDSYTLPY